MYSTSRTVVRALAVALLVALAAVPASAQEGNASVRVAHLSPDAPNVDVYVDGSPVLTDFAYKQISDVLQLPAASYDVAVRPVGAAPDSAPAIQATVQVEAGRSYTIAAVGLLDSIQAQVYESPSSPPADGKANVRAIHAAPEVPAVDIAAGGTVVLSSLEFPNASEYLTVDAGPIDVEVRGAGSADALLTASTTLESGMSYSIIAVGGADQSPELIAIVDAAGATETPADLGTQTGEGGAASTSDATGWIVTSVILVGLATFVMVRVRRSATR